MTFPLPPHYPLSSGRYDEMVDGSGRARAHWQAFLQQAQQDGAQALRAQAEAVQRQVREHGVTLNAWAAEEGDQRPWDLDLLPLVLPAEEWAHIESAIVQRATLLNRVLGDLYGAQDCIARGLVPAALVHGNPGFLRAAHGTPHADGTFLHVYAADLARAPDGRWWVVSDRTQAPAGAGYALENRHIIARAFPELYRDLKVQHVQGFFTALRDSLAHSGRLCAAQAMAGTPPLREDEAPLVVLLTPGPTHETYYEQSYLARHLGYPLVEGKDLTVRGGIVWLKTLAGLQRVHVILRHVEDESCDPLELRANATTGVAGLADAARRGSVVLANGLGACLLESGALLGYLPGLAQSLLGEPLRMPSVATWWCGEQAALDDVLTRLSSLVIKPAYPHARIAPVFGADLTAGQRFNLVRDMRARPQQYLAQEFVHLAQAPVWRDGQLQAAPAGLRVYACATPQGYVVLPGGLARVAGAREARLINMQRGGAAKDTWVLAPEHAVPSPAPHGSAAQVALARGNAFLASRVVENLFWYGRYAARCDHLTRLTRTALDFLVDVAPDERGGEWQTVQGLCRAYALLGDAREPEASLSDAEIEQALLQAVVAQDRPGLAHHLQLLYAVAGKLRERLSLDNWRTLNQLIKQANDAVRHPTLADAAGLLDDAARALMTLSGFALDGMTRDDAWRFMSIGRRLERLQFMCAVLRHALQMPADGALDWLLELADSIVTYRSRYMARPEWRTVLDLLVRDDSNPRALAFLLEGLAGYLNKLTQHYGPCGAEHFLTLQAELQQLDPDRDLAPDSVALATLLARIEQSCHALSDQIGMRFFSYSEGTPHG